jgi:hypothetical protein
MNYFQFTPKTLLPACSVLFLLLSLSCGFELISGPHAGGCIPVECESLGHNACGLLNDGCGGVIDCAACGRSGDENEDGCITWTCTDVGFSCGWVDDGCDGLMDCGSCAEGEICGGSGYENVCCIPTNCGLERAECGEITDGCGNNLDCGECDNEETCGGAGPNLCGEDACIPYSCDELEIECGIIADGCSGTLDCGQCPDDQLCGGGGVPYECGTLDVTPTGQDPNFTGGCLNFPDEPFSTTNFVPEQVVLQAGDTMPDFVLNDINGQEISFYDLLQEKPVMLQTGSYTCNHFQDYMVHTNEFVEAYSARVHIVIVYTVEAHPIASSTPYHGTIVENEYSLFSQPFTYEERVSNASALNLDSRIIMLIDDLSPGLEDNPFWCSVLTAPNGSMLIDQNGKIQLAHAWLEHTSMEEAIETLLSSSPSSP